MLLALVCFGRSAAQILQTGPRQLAMLGGAPCSRWWSVFVAQQPKSSKTDLASLVRLAVLLALVCFGRSAAQILQNGPQQPKSSKTVLATLVSLAVLLALPLDLQILAENRYVCLAGSSGGPFWPLSSSNLPKRTSPAWSAWLSPLLSLCWSVSAAQQPKSFKTDLASLLCLAVLPAPAGGPFWPLSSPNPPKRTSPASSAWPCSLLSLWWSVLAAQQPESSKRTSQLAMLGCAPCSPSGGPFWPLSSPNPPKRTFPTTGGRAQPDSNPQFLG